ncbi:MAG: phosphatidylserine decarboxylase [Gammaproteobacteria bacterium]
MTQVPSGQHPLVAREGRTAVFVTVAAGLALYASFGVAAALPAGVAALLLCLYFRDPHRDSPSLPLAVVSPVDGRIIAAGRGYDPWLGRDAVRVGVLMGPLDVHSLFSPVEGKIMEQWSTPPHPANGAAPANAGLAYLIRTDEGDEVVLEIARGQIAGALRFAYQPGERVGHGRRIGYAALGCRVTVYSDASSRLDCAEGDRARAAATVISTLVHDSPVSAIPPEEVAAAAGSG